MDTYHLDEVDARLLSLLQDDARYTATELAARLDVSDNTVHNRMQRLETEGIVRGYRAVCDPKRLGLTFHYLFVATARVVERGDLAAAALEVPQVTSVVELMTGRENLLIEAVGADDDEITRVAEELDGLGIEIRDEHFIRAEHEKSVDYGRLQSTHSD